MYRVTGVFKTLDEYKELFSQTAEKIKTDSEAYAEDENKTFGIHLWGPVDTSGVPNKMKLIFNEAPKMKEGREFPVLYGYVIKTVTATGMNVEVNIRVPEDRRGIQQLFGWECHDGEIKIIDGVKHLTGTLKVTGVDKSIEVKIDIKNPEEG